MAPNPPDARRHPGKAVAPLDIGGLGTVAPDIRSDGAPHSQWRDRAGFGLAAYRLP